MPTYHYTAIDRSVGNTVSGLLSADTARAALAAAGGRVRVAIDALEPAPSQEVPMA